MFSSLSKLPIQYTHDEEQLAPPSSTTSWLRSDLRSDGSGLTLGSLRVCSPLKLFWLHGCLVPNGGSTSLRRDTSRLLNCAGLYAPAASQIRPSSHPPVRTLYTSVVLSAHRPVRYGLRTPAYALLCSAASCPPRSRAGRCVRSLGSPTRYSVDARSTASNTVRGSTVSTPP